MILCEDITKSYGNNCILKGIDISFEPGKIATLLGPSGAGKTTFLRILALLEKPDQGKIVFPDDYKPDEQNGSISFLNGNQSFWPNVTIVFQQLFLWPHMTIKQNILFPFQWRKIDRLEEKYKNLIEKLDIAHIQSRRPLEVSQGQRQLSSLVRALLLEPKCLILDEVTSALDLKKVSVVGKLLFELKKKGTAIVLVTHLIPFAKAISDQLYYLENATFNSIYNEKKLSFVAEKWAQDFALNI